MDKYSETQLLRMSKNELIEHIFYLYRQNESQFRELATWYTSSEMIHKLREKKLNRDDV